MALWTDQVTLANPANPLFAVTAFNRDVYFVYVDDSGNVQFSRSTDEGQSGLTSFTNIASATSGDVNLDRPLVVDPVTGTLHLLYSRNESQGTTAQLYYRRSTNQGATWSAEVTIDDGSTHGTQRFYRVGLAAYAGIVHIGYVSTDDTVFTSDGLFYRRSSNDGVTFAAALQPFPSAVSPGRPDICVNGSFVHFTWTDDRFGALAIGGETFYGRSVDYGVTFTETRLTFTALVWGAGSTLRPVVSCGSDGAVTIGWQDPGNTAGSEDIYYIHSVDNGASWGAITLLATGSGTQEHLFFAQSGRVLMAVWADSSLSPTQPQMSFSTNSGETFGAASNPVVSANTSSAPRCAVGSNMFYLLNTDGVAGLRFSRNPYFLTVPDTTRVLDNCTRANTGPPPSASWTNGILTTVGGEGLVVLSNTITRKSSGGYRQGSYWNTKMTNPNHEVFFKVSGLPTATNDGFALWFRMTSPGGGAAMSGYGADVSFDGSNLVWVMWRTDGLSTATITTGPTINRTVAVNDYVSGQMYGPLIYVWQYVAASSDWYLVWNGFDGKYQSGVLIGLEALNNQDFSISSFGGGVIPQVAASTVPQQPVPAGRATVFV